MPYRAIVISLMVTAGLSLSADSTVAQAVFSFFPYTYQQDSASATVLESLAVTADGDIIGVGYAAHYPDSGSGEIYWRKAVAVRFSPQGEVIWEKLHPLGGLYINNDTLNWTYSCDYKAILPFEDGYLVAGEAIVNSSLMISLCNMDQQGDTVWCKYYGVSQHTPRMHSMMLQDGELVICGVAFSPSTPTSPPGQHGLIIRTSTDGVLLDVAVQETPHDSEFHNYLNFIGLDVDGSGQVRVFGNKVENPVAVDGWTRYFQMYGLEETELPLLLQDSIGLHWRAAASGAVGQGNLSYSDTSVMYAANSYNLAPFQNHMVRSHISFNEMTHEPVNIHFLPQGEVVEEVFGHVRFGEMDFIYARSWKVGHPDRRIFAMAVHRESAHPAWHFLSEMDNDEESWGRTAVALDSATGIATFCSSEGLGNWDVSYQNRVYRFDLRRIYPFVLSSSSVVFTEKFQAWPNPFDDHLTIELPGQGNPCSVIITDMHGRQLLSQQVMHGRSAVATGNLPAGLYTITVADEHGKAVSQRMVKLNR